MNAHRLILAVILLLLSLSHMLSAQLVWQINGDAYLDGDRIILTQSVGNQVGAVWYRNPIDLNQNFNYSSEVYLGNNNSGGDGIAFVLHNAADGLDAVGGPGGSLGAGGDLYPSIAVEIDTWQNFDLPYDPVCDHAGVSEYLNDSSLPDHSGASPICATDPETNIEDGSEHTLGINWDALSNTLTVHFDSVQRLTYTKDIVNDIFKGESNIYFGFTGATGGRVNFQYFVPNTIYIDYVSPSSRGQGATGQTIFIPGTDFVDGAAVSFSGDGITVNSTNFISSTMLAANVDVALDAAVGTRDIAVTNPGETGTMVGTFDVNAAPTVTDASPDSLPQGSENANVIISGSNFVDNLIADPNGPQLAADFGDGITVNSVSFTSSTALIANISISLIAEIGARNFTIVNGDAGVEMGTGLFSVTITEDITPPAAVTDLSAVIGNSVELAWTAPGDEGDIGTASTYIIRYNTEEITEANWDESWDVDGEPTPSPAGTPESMTLDMPYPGVTYYFALKTQDEVPNTSEISNSPSATEGITIQLLTGWNLVSVVCMTMIPIDDLLASVPQCDSIWVYHASIPGWLRHIVGAPDFLNTLIHIGPGYGIWIHVTDDCSFDCSEFSIASPTKLMIRRPPFLLYGEVSSEPESADSEAITLVLRDEEISGYIIGSNAHYGNHYVMEIPVNDSSYENEAAQVYVNGIPADGAPIELGGMGVVRRYDIFYMQAPGVTRLLQNYPNPFNPETWIPYHLADEADVVIKIHDTTGRLSCTLNLGHQRAGFYTGREKAAYWDGRNAVGESAASGIYFYTIQAGEFAATRKMIITK